MSMVTWKIECLCGGRCIYHKVSTNPFMHHFRTWKHIVCWISFIYTVFVRKNLKSELVRGAATFACIVQYSWCSKSANGAAEDHKLAAMDYISCTTRCRISRKCYGSFLRCVSVAEIMLCGDEIFEEHRMSSSASAVLYWCIFIIKLRCC